MDVAKVEAGTVADIDAGAGSEADICFDASIAMFSIWVSSWVGTSLM